MIKAVIFDAEDVIYYRDEETLGPILEFFKKKGFNISAKWLKNALDEYRLESFKGRISKDGHLKKTLEFLKIKFDDEFFNKFAKVFRKNFSNIKIKDGISDAFKKIKSRGIKIAILTDTFSTEQKKWEWFKNVNLAQFIDVIVCSSETGHTKDEKEAYEIALHKLNLKSGEVIFVGHKKYEMQGARLAGVKSVSIEKNVGGDYYVGDISEILSLIKRLS